MADHNGKIENWSTDEENVVGNISGDTKGRFPDGLLIHTSPIVTPVADLKEGAIIETKNSRYLLGKKRGDNNEKKKYLFYYEDGCDAFTPAPEKIEHIFDINDFDHGETTNIEFKIFSFTDAEFAALPED